MRTGPLEQLLLNDGGLMLKPVHEVRLGKCRTCPNKYIPLNDRDECHICATLAAVPPSPPHKIARRRRKGRASPHPIIG